MLVQPFEAPIGADALDVRIAEISDSEFDELYQAWLRCGVLRFRDQKLSDDELKTFSARFGELEYAPHGKVTAGRTRQDPQSVRRNDFEYRRERQADWRAFESQDLLAYRYVLH